MRLKRFGLITLILAASLLGGRSAKADKVTLVFVPGLSAGDFLSPRSIALQQLVRGGEVAWMMSRTARVASAPNPDTVMAEATGYLTLSSGARAAPWRDKGGLPLARGRLNPMDAERLRQAQQCLDYAVPIGALSKSLARHGLSAALFGNADTSRLDRSAGLFLLGSNDTVHGTVDDSNCNRLDPTAPYSLRFDIGKAARWLKVNENTPLCVIVFGDLLRAETDAPFCTPVMARLHRDRALSRLNRLLMVVQQQAGKTGRTIILGSPAPTAAQQKNGDVLTPLVIWSPSHRVGWLYSPATHRRGLCLNTEFQDIVLHRLGIRTSQPAPSVAIHIKSGAQTANSYVALYHHLRLNAEEQHAIGGWPTLQAALVIIAGLACFFALKRKEPGFQKFVQFTVRSAGTVVIALPLVVLLVPLLNPLSVAVAALECAAVLVLVAWLGAAQWKIVTLMLAGLLIGITLLDLWMGGHLQRDSLFGYSVMEGARFYGIGNEAAASLIAAALVVGTGLPFGWAALLWAIIALTIGAPEWGANAGGYIAAAVSFCGAAFIWRIGRLGLRQWLVIAGITLSGLILLVKLDMLRKISGQTHIARALEVSRHQGMIHHLGDIMLRKLAMDGHLLVHSVWMFPLLAIALIATQLYRAGALGPMPRTASARALAKGLLIAMVSTMIFNDSGVVMASLIALYGWGTLFPSLTHNNQPPYNSRSSSTAG